MWQRAAACGSGLQIAAVVVAAVDSGSGGSRGRQRQWRKTAAVAVEGGSGGLLKCRKNFEKRNVWNYRALILKLMAGTLGRGTPRLLLHPRTLYVYYSVK